MSEQRLWDNLRVHGFEIVRQRKHRVYKNPMGQTFIVPSTPSDRRWSANALADLARLCGPTETDPRPLRARRQHGRLERIEPRSAEQPQPPVELIPAPVPAPALSRADRQRLKRWEKHEGQRAAKGERQLAKLRDLAYRAHALLETDDGGDRGRRIVGLTRGIRRRVRQLGFQDVALSAAGVTACGHSLGLAIYLRVGGRYVDVLAGVVREGPTWTDDGAQVEVWGDVQPEDIKQLADEPLYLGPGHVDPALYHLELKIRDGETVELVLFEALLSYEQGVAPVIVLNDTHLLHGRETVDHLAANEGPAIRAELVKLEVDGEAFEEISSAYNAEDCDWLEMLEGARRNFMAGARGSESYVAWLKREIAMRGGETAAA
jgi:hypothetical protein